MLSQSSKDAGTSVLFFLCPEGSVPLGSLLDMHSKNR